ncbi:MAG TPA: cation:proton antiporter [Stellaceae bacterium]|nr:cation:proton antiporter [Stellaceae bacterium]
MPDVAVSLLIIASLLVVVALIQPVATRLRLPPAVLLAVVGVAIGTLASYVLASPLTHALDGLASLFVDLPITSAAFINIFLPILLFEAAIAIDVRRMIEDAAPILLLAVVAVFVTTAAIGVSLSLLSGEPLVVCLLLGSIVATTDPAAVVTIFRDLGAPARLTRLVEGESLLNDAAAIALFTVMLDMLVRHAEPSIAEGAWQFFGAFGGGIALGIIGARLMIRLIPVLAEMRPAEATLTLALPYLVFIIGDRFLDVSGVVAVVTAGLTLSATGRSRILPENWRFLTDLWGQVGFWASSLVFVLASILVPRLLVDVSWNDAILLAALIGAALLARGLVLFMLLPLLSLLGLSQRVSNAFKIVITWGGLRGAVTLALALAVTENGALDQHLQRFVTVLATGFVLFTLFVNGTTLRALIGLLKLDQLSPLNQALRNQVLALSLARVRDVLRETATEHALSDPATAQAIRPYSKRIKAATEDAEAPAIGDRDRLTVGLIALASQERTLILDHREQRTASMRMVELLLRNVGRISDAARSQGRLGYKRAADAIVDFPLALRLANALHRRLGIEGALARALADRFEMLLLTRMLLQQLVRFNESRLTALLGARVGAVLGEVLRSRLSRTATALDALRLQYPDYAEALERRFLGQAALRQEIVEYETLFDDGLVGQELFDDLRRSVTARSDIERQPRLDLGLNTLELARKLDFFTDLAEPELNRLAALFKPVFVVPDEIIIRKGDRGDAVFFISSGAVEVVLDTGNIRLGSGEFFGEMALLSRRRRQADVKALAYCRLLTLSSNDFETFLAHNPDVRACINDIAAARIRMNNDALAAAEATAV